MSHKKSFLSFILAASLLILIYALFGYLGPRRSEAQTQTPGCFEPEMQAPQQLQKYTQCNKDGRCDPPQQLIYADRRVKFSFCYLRGAGFEDQDSNDEHGRCSIYMKDGFWWLHAYAYGDDAGVKCWAHCIYYTY